MKFTLKQFNDKFPDDDACLQYMFDSRYVDIKVCQKCGIMNPRYYRVKSKKVFECKDCGYQISPLANTIFHKSDTSLRFWFYAIFMFSVSKNGVSAKELERTFGVTYKCAWRMAKQIRILMQQGDGQLSGTVEVDETYMGGVHKGKNITIQDKAPVFGMVERGGSVRAAHVMGTGARVLHLRIRKSIAVATTIYSDQAQVYKALGRMGFAHDSVDHSIGEYGRGKAHTNTVEGFWSQMKRSIDGTYHCVSPKHLQRYVDEFAFRYNHRTQAIFPVLVSQVSRSVS